MTTDQLHDLYMSYGTPHWMTEDSQRQTLVFRQMVLIDKNEPGRGKDDLENGATL